MADDAAILDVADLHKTDLFELRSIRYDIALCRILDGYPFDGRFLGVRRREALLLIDAVDAKKSFAETVIPHLHLADRSDDCFCLHLDFAADKDCLELQIR